jgi:hypothetical protein
MAVRVKPMRGLTLDLGYTSAIKGPVRAFQQINGVNNTAGAVWIESISYMSDMISLRANYEIINDLFIFAEGSYRKVSGINVPDYVAPFYYGTGSFNNGSTKTINVGLNAGF